MSDERISLRFSRASPMLRRTARSEHPSISAILAVGIPTRCLSRNRLRCTAGICWNARSSASDSRRAEAPQSPRTRGAAGQSRPACRRASSPRCGTLPAPHPHFLSHRTVSCSLLRVRPAGAAADRSAKKDGQGAWLLSVWRIGGYSVLIGCLFYRFDALVTRTDPLRPNETTVSCPLRTISTRCDFPSARQTSLPTAFLTSCIESPPFHKGHGDAWDSRMSRRCKTEKPSLLC